MARAKNVCKNESSELDQTVRRNRSSRQILSTYLLMSISRIERGKRKTLIRMVGLYYFKARSFFRSPGDCMTTVCLCECLSYMMGNYRIRLLGGKGAVMHLTYPVAQYQGHLKRKRREEKNKEEIV
jgi:hypothetical protein